MNEANYQWNKKATKCLRINHNIVTIGDLTENREKNDCTTACHKMIERLIGMTPEIINPLKETPIKVKNLDHTPRRIKENQENGERKTFNPDITEREDILKPTRLFSEIKVKPIKPANRK